MNDHLIKWEFNDVLRLLKPKPNEKILDIGCNIGEFCYILYSKFRAVPRGVDINKEAIKIAKATYPHLQFDVKNIFEPEFLPF